MLEGRQAEQGKRQLGLGGGLSVFILNCSLETKGNQSASKDHCKRIKVRWKTKWHRQGWHGERAAQDQQQYNLHTLWSQDLLCVCEHACTRPHLLIFIMFSFCRKKKYFWMMTYLHDDSTHEIRVVVISQRVFLDRLRHFFLLRLKVISVSI